MTVIAALVQVVDFLRKALVAYWLTDQGHDEAMDVIQALQGIADPDADNADSMDGEVIK